MTALLVDSSVIFKWFHEDGESEVAEARAIRDANQRGTVDACIIDLALYEVGNILLVRLRWNAEDIADQLHDLITICGTPFVTTPAWLRDAAALAAANRLTFYDAAWAATARGLGITLVSADAALLAAGLAQSPAAAARQLRLR
ncbi:MAG TPA: type II toxin-antitoxin system VapC family toxin [Candidatus Dormibacteraeota bacterium]|nr:type II toxin-antitoxin system VapC family toxin [Candidatus Dormibacteraeota bacterium]